MLTYQPLGIEDAGYFLKSVGGMKNCVSVRNAYSFTENFGDVNRAKPQMSTNCGDFEKFEITIDDTTGQWCIVNFFWFTYLSMYDYNEFGD